MGDVSVRKRRVGAVGAVTAVLAAALSLGWARQGDTPVADPRPVPVATTTSSAPTTSSTTTTTAAPVTASTLPGVVLPVPQPLPTDEYAPTPEHVIGGIEIPAIGLAEQLHEGMTLTAINRGPSHWPGTAVPGQLGNVVVGGHRTTYSQPFRNLDLLQPGDQLVFTVGGERQVYELTQVQVVDPSEVQIADQSAAYTATLFACHPPGSARYRIVATFQLVDAAGEPVPAPAVQVLNQAETIAYRS